MATLQQCKWDGKCYRKNPQHIKEYSHPEQTMLKLIEWKETDDKTNNISDKKTKNISDGTIEWKYSGTEREIYKAWLKWVTEKTLKKQFDENEKKEVFGILMNLEEDATGGEFNATDGKFKELLKAQGEHFKNSNGEFVFSNSHLFPYLKPASDEPELPPTKRRRITTPKGGKKTRKSKKKTRKSKKRTRKSKTKRRKNI
jgi:hypothetical protein